MLHQSRVERVGLSLNSTILSDAHLTYIHSAKCHTYAGVDAPVGSSWSLSCELIGPDLLLWRIALPLAPTRIGKATIRLCVFPSPPPGIIWGPVLHLLLTAPSYCQARIEILHMLLTADQTHHLIAPPFCHALRYCILLLNLD